jgi:hypothetical protein
VSRHRHPAAEEYEAIRREPGYPAVANELAKARAVHTNDDAPPAEPGTPDECEEYEDDDVDPTPFYCQGCGALSPRSLCTPTCEVQLYPSIPDDCPTCSERRPGCACDRSALAEAMADEAPIPDPSGDEWDECWDDDTLD